MLTVILHVFAGFGGITVSFSFSISRNSENARFPKILAVLSVALTVDGDGDGDGDRCC